MTTPIKVIFLKAEPEKKKSTFDMKYDTVDGYLLSQHLQDQINDIQEEGYHLLKMDQVNGHRYGSGTAIITLLGYLLFFEKITVKPT